MGRLIEHDADGPLKIDEDDIDEEYGDVAVCRCGLSAEYPFCDGSHRATDGEEDGVVYRYEGDAADGERRRVSEVVLAEDREEE